MVDPLSILGAVGAVANIIDLITKSLSTMREIHGRWREADLVFMSLMSQLTALRAALQKIQEWANRDLDEENDLQLVMDLDVSITCCVALMEQFDMFLVELHRSPGAPLDFAAKVKLLFGTKDLDGVQKMVERQVSALTLLLVAFSCKSVSQQKTLLKSSQSRKIIRRMENDSASLFVHRDPQSLITNQTDNLSRWSVRFDFDGELFVTRVYEKLIRGSLRHTFARPKTCKHHGDNVSLDAPIAIGQPEELLEAKKRSRMIDRDLRRDRSLSRSQITSLVLGDSMSGKEWILNQMKCASQGGYTVAERMKYQQSIHGTVIGSINFLLKTMRGMGITPELEVNRGNYDFLFDYVLNRDSNQSLNSNIGDAIHSIWNDPCIEEVRNRSLHFRSMDRVSYFCTHAQRITAPEYIPSDADILRAYIKSSGLHTIRIHEGTLTFDLSAADLKAAHSVKWLHQFENVQSIIFAVDLSCYDQLASSKRFSNRMAENMAFFDRIVNLKSFQRTAIIILFNYVNILKQKLAFSPLCDHFPEFGGGHDPDKARNFLMERFVQLNRSKGRGIYCHFTDMDDSFIFQHVMGSLKDIIVQSNVRSLVIQDGMGLSSCGKEYISQRVENLEKHPVVKVEHAYLEMALAKREVHCQE